MASEIGQKIIDGGQLLPLFDDNTVYSLTDVVNHCKNAPIVRVGGWEELHKKAVTVLSEVATTVANRENNPSRRFSGFVLNCALTISATLGYSGSMAVISSFHRALIASTLQHGTPQLTPVLSYTGGKTALYRVVQCRMTAIALVLMGVTVDNAVKCVDDMFSEEADTASLARTVLFLLPTVTGAGYTMSATEIQQESMMSARFQEIFGVTNRDVNQRALFSAMFFLDDMMDFVLRHTVSDSDKIDFLQRISRLDHIDAHLLFQCMETIEDDNSLENIESVVSQCEQLFYRTRDADVETVSYHYLWKDRLFSCIENFPTHRRSYIVDTIMYYLNSVPVKHHEMIDNNFEMIATTLASAFPTAGDTATEAQHNRAVISSDMTFNAPNTEEVEHGVVSCFPPRMMHQMIAWCHNDVNTWLDCMTQVLRLHIVSYNDYYALERVCDHAEDITDLPIQWAYSFVGIEV